MPFSTFKENELHFTLQTTSFLIFISVKEKQFRRWLTWQIDKKKYAKSRQYAPLPFRVKKHQSKLVKKLGNSDMQLQHNKVQSLKIVAKNISGIIIKPGETFSLCKTVGKPTLKKGSK